MAVRTGWQGRFYEDFEVGDVYQHPLGRTISEEQGAAASLFPQAATPLAVEGA